MKCSSVLISKVSTASGCQSHTNFPVLDCFIQSFHLPRTNEFPWGHAGSLPRTPPNVFSVGLQIQLGLGTPRFEAQTHHSNSLLSQEGPLCSCLSPCKVSAPSGTAQGTVGDGVKLQEEENDLGNGPSPLGRPRLSPGWPKKSAGPASGTCTSSGLVTSVSRLYTEGNKEEQRRDEMIHEPCLIVAT